MFMLEVQWWTQRALWHLMFSGVFERHPDLDYVITETGTAWVPDTLAKLDSFYHRMKFSRYGSESIFGGQAVAQMSLTPSEYFERQCHIGASFLRPAETEVAKSVGTHKVMWGSDYPHIEGSHPHTKEHLRLTFANYSVDEAVQIPGSPARYVQYRATLSRARDNAPSPSLVPSCESMVDSLFAQMGALTKGN